MELSLLLFPATARSKPGIIASMNALRSIWPSACHVSISGLVSFPFRSTSAATLSVLRFLNRCDAPPIAGAAVGGFFYNWLGAQEVVSEELGREDKTAA